MRKISTIVIIAILFVGCKRVADGTKKAINKTGQVAGEGSSEFVKGVSKGVETSMECQIELGKTLTRKGVTFARFTVGSDTNSRNNNKLTAYLIFDDDFSGSISAKVLDPKHVEYGRANVSVTAKKGEAKYIDFIFDKRTDVESKSTFVLE